MRFMDLWIYGFMDLWIYGFMDLWIYFDVLEMGLSREAQRPSEIEL
jgi:hypothetical protein